MSAPVGGGDCRHDRTQTRGGLLSARRGAQTRPTPQENPIRRGATEQSGAGRRLRIVHRDCAASVRAHRMLRRTRPRSKFAADRLGTSRRFVSPLRSPPPTRRRLPCIDPAATIQYISKTVAQTWPARLRACNKKRSRRAPVPHPQPETGAGRGDRIFGKEGWGWPIRTGRLRPRSTLSRVC